MLLSGVIGILAAFVILLLIQYLILPVLEPVLHVGRFSGNMKDWVRTVKCFVLFMMAVLPAMFILSRDSIMDLTVAMANLSGIACVLVHGHVFPLYCVIAAVTCIYITWHILMGYNW